MAQNMLSNHSFFQNLCKGLKDMSQKADLERDHALPRSCHINIKGGAKGLDWCYIGEKWRKVAEIG